MRGIGAIIQQKVIGEQLLPDIPTNINLLELVGVQLPEIPTSINAVYEIEIPTAIQVYELGAPLFGTLSAETPTHNSVVLNWTVGADGDAAIAGYHLFVSVPEANLDVGNVLTHEVVSMNPETTYQFYAKTYDVNGKYSAASNLVEVTTEAEPVYTYLLDTYPNAAAAYSLRKLKTGANYACEVRRDSDNALANVILEETGSITLASQTDQLMDLGTWVGSNSAYVETWYDQSGNSNDITPATAAEQPRIVNTGTLDIDNSLSALDFNGTSHQFLSVASMYTASISVFSVWNLSTSSEANVYNISDGSSKATALGFNNTAGQLSSRTTTPNTSDSIAFSQNTQYISIAISDETNNNMWLNNTLATGSVIARKVDNSSHIGSRGNVYYFNGTIQEIIIFSADKTSDRTAIETDINTHYSIY